MPPWLLAPANCRQSTHIILLPPQTNLQSLAKVNYTCTLATLLGRFSFVLTPEVNGEALKKRSWFAPWG